MARPSWLVDGKRIATKIKSASGSCDPRKVIWKSNPCRTCPNCSQRIDNTDVSQEWPGLPRGVKFDPSDQELLWHLMTKAENAADTPHPFIDEFIPSVLEEDGICYTHPEKLPGVKKDGSIAHFFHRTMNAYNTGTRKRRRIHGGHDSVQGDVRWHKTGKTKPVLVDGIRKGWKKIMVLYASSGKGGKAEKTNWVMHQYHLGDEEEEKDGALVVSKVFYQQPQQSKQKDKYDEDALHETVQPSISSLDPATPIPARKESLANKVQNGGDPVQNQHKFEDDLVQEQVSYSKESSAQVIDPEMVNEENGASSQPGFERIDDQMANEENGASSQPGYETIDDQNIHSADPKWWEGESQNILDSQQLLEALYTCDEILQSQSSADNGVRKPKPCLADYTRIGVETFKKDLEECSKLNHVDSTNIVQESPNDIRLSQLDIPIGSQDSFSWLKLE